MPIKLTSTTEEGKRGKKKKKSKRIYRTSQKIRVISVILESLLSESFATLGITVHLGCPRTLYWPLDLLWGLLLLSHFSRVQLCATHRRQPTRLPRLWDSPGKNTGVGCHILLQCMKVKSECEVSQSCPTLSDPMDCSLPGSSVHGISRQEYWSGVPLPSPIYKTRRR